MKKIIALAAFFFMLAVPVHGQTIDLSATPPQVQILMKPDTSLLQAITFQNSGDPGVFSLEVVSFVPQGERGGRQLKQGIEGPLRFSLENSHLALGDRFNLDSKESFQALLKIRTTAQAAHGDYYYLLFLQSDPPVSQQSAGRARAKIGVNILISVSSDGLTPASIRVAQFQVIPDYTLSLLGHSVYIKRSGSPAAVVVVLANTGSYYFAPNVKIEAQGPLGYEREATLVPINILAGSQRLLTTEELECMGESCPANTSAVFRTGAWGKYTVTAQVDLEGTSERMYGVTEFWVLPVTLLQVIAFLFVAGVVSMVIISKTTRLRPETTARQGKGVR